MAIGWRPQPKGDEAYRRWDRSVEALGASWRLVTRTPALRATAATAKEFGLRVDVQPETADIASVIEALAEHAIHLRDVEGFDRPPRKTKSRAKKA